jgi:hypothetical protein
MRSTLSCSAFFSLSNETLLKKIGCKIAEKQAKYDLSDFSENWKQSFFWKSHISVKNDLFDLKIWLQRFLNMGYRMDIVKFKSKIFHVTWILDGLMDPLLNLWKNFFCSFILSWTIEIVFVLFQNRSNDSDSKSMYTISFQRKSYWNKWRSIVNENTIDIFKKQFQYIQ